MKKERRKEQKERKKKARSREDDVALLPNWRDTTEEQLEGLGRDDDCPPLLDDEMSQAFLDQPAVPLRSG